MSVPGWMDRAMKPDDKPTLDINIEQITFMKDDELGLPPWTMYFCKLVPTDETYAAHAEDSMVELTRPLTETEAMVGELAMKRKAEQDTQSQQNDIKNARKLAKHLFT